MSLSSVVASIEISVFSAMVLMLNPLSMRGPVETANSQESHLDDMDWLAAEGLNQRLENAKFSEMTPDFTDLYIIHTQDKGREITIYCSATHCYKSLRKRYPA